MPPKAYLKTTRKQSLNKISRTHIIATKRARNPPIIREKRP